MQYTGQYEQIQYFNQENINISLHNRELWSQFHEITNEMIVTKTGRRMFPIISVNIRGLDPDKMYTIELAFDQLDSHRWRYASCKWQPGMKADPVIRRSSYQHPDSPNYGRTWMKEIISFPKVKLTNKIDHTDASQVILNSLHKYRPRISIIDVMLKKKIYETSFDETEFIAVTAYQNEEVKALKIRHNPFAKAFLDVENLKREANDEEMNHGPMIYSQASSSGGPDRVKHHSYRSSPYSYSQRKSVPVNGFDYPSSSTSPCDLSPFYGSIPTATIPPCSSSSPPPLSDNIIHNSNLYYPSPSPYPYYFSYSGQSSSSISHYPFIPAFNYPLNNNNNNNNDNSLTQENTSFLQMQPPMPMPSNETNYMNSLIPIANDGEQY